MKIVKLIFFVIFVFNTLLYGKSYIIKIKKAHSYKEFLKYYKKVDNLTFFSGKRGFEKILPNRTHKFKFVTKRYFTNTDKKNIFSNNSDPLLEQQDWLKVINGLDLINLSRGSGIIVGLLDSGVELEHEDLKGQFLKYYNVAENSDDVSDGFGHGTSVAGIIGAIANNGIGIRGVAPEVKFVVAKINKGASPTFDDYSVAEAIYYLVDNGAKIINMSIQMEESNEIIDDAISYAVNKDVILVAASGNGGEDKESYPASSNYVLGVGSVNNDFEISSFSNYDKNIFIMAPGDQVLTTYINNRYNKESGTSFSAPIITGIIADILSLNRYLKLSDIIQIILNNSFNDTTNSFKVVNLSEAIYGTGVKFILNKEKFAKGDSLYLSMLLPPLSSNFDFYFGFILPDNKIAVLQYNNNGFFYAPFTYNSEPTYSFSFLSYYSMLNLYGEDNSFFSPLKLEGNLEYGEYKACGLYLKDSNILGYVNCKKFYIEK